jgi:4-phosphopantoate--beta-alanine ligase
MGKTEIVIDLNPLSRSAQSAAVPVVDNIIRAVPNMTDHARTLRDRSEAELREIIDAFDPETALASAEQRIREGDLD